MNNYKSKGEREIAKFLEEMNIKFVYEKPYLINDERENLRIWYPDFWLVEYGIIIEFFGVENSESYDKLTKIKKRTYKKDHLEMIPVYPKTLEKNWKSYIKLKIKDIIENKYFSSIDLEDDFFN